MATTLQNRIELEGVTVTDPTTLTIQLTDSAEDIIGLLPESCLREVMTEATDTGGGVDVSACRFVRAYKNGRKATEIRLEERSLSESGGAYQAREDCPVYYKSGNKVFILPGGGTVAKVDYPEVEYDDTGIAGWPRPFGRLVALHAAMKLKEQELQNTRRDLPPLDPPEVPAFTYDDVVSAGIEATTIGSAPSLALDFTDFDAFVDDEDTELAAAALSKVRTQIEDYAAQIQKTIEQARLTQDRLARAAALADDAAKQNAIQNLLRQVQEYDAALSRYSQEVQARMQVFVTKARQLRIELDDLKRRFGEQLEAYTRAHSSGASTLYIQSYQL